MLRVDSVSFGYGSARHERKNTDSPRQHSALVLDAVSLQVERGLIVGLLEKESHATPLSLFEREALISDVINELFGRLNKEAKDIVHSPVSSEQLGQVLDLIADGTISGGMIPKVETCMYALEAGVEGVVILDGKVEHAVLMELLTDGGAGTLMHR